MIRNCWVKRTDLIFQKTDFFFRFPEGRVNYGEVTLVNFSAGEANLKCNPNKTSEIIGGPFVEMKDIVKEKRKISNLSPVTWQVGGPLIKEKAGLSIEVDEGDKHSCFLLHLQPSHKVGRPLNTHAVSCLIVSRQKYIKSVHDQLPGRQQVWGVSSWQSWQGSVLETLVRWGRRSGREMTTTRRRWRRRGKRWRRQCGKTSTLTRSWRCGLPPQSPPPPSASWNTSTSFDVLSRSCHS